MVIASLELDVLSCDSLVMRRHSYILLSLLIVAPTMDFSFPSKPTNNGMKREDSIGARVAQRKRGWNFFADTPRSRRKLNIQQEQYTDDDISVIKQVFGDYQHHGTGNPLNMRAPSTPSNQDVKTLAAIIQNGLVGQVSSNSTPKLKTERGKSGSFWVNRLRLAGSYGWTGLVLPKDCKTDNPLPIAKVKWFLVESLEEMELLKKILIESDKWEEVRERVITVAQLAELARCER